MQKFLSATRKGGAFFQLTGKIKKKRINLPRK